MIISASRRTDIPAFHSEWFLNRLEEGFVLVSHSGKSRKLYRIPLNPDVGDCFAFRTKNPVSMMNKLDRLNGYNYFFNITMNPYGQEMESNLPDLRDRISVFKQLSEKIGPLRMVWRYDPVFISPKYNIDFHTRAFNYLCKELQGKAYKCMIGFIIHHPFVANRINPLNIERKSDNNVRAIGELFSEISKKYGIPLETCAEKIDIDEFGVKHGACVERSQIEQITGYNFGNVKEKYLRPHCNCMESVDIGHYSTCDNGCLYCYATPIAPNMNTPPSSPSLDPEFDESYYDKYEIETMEATSLKNLQQSLF
ncbi:MAG: DUF1848 domain-containing protein [Rikenellaceae bacterium]|nr:DUF1848 domain-containing protein [Rikenellaceae bacterium]